MHEAEIADDREGGVRVAVVVTAVVVADVVATVSRALDCCSTEDGAWHKMGGWDLTAPRRAIEVGLYVMSVGLV